MYTLTNPIAITKSVAKFAVIGTQRVSIVDKQFEVVVAALASDDTLIQRYTLLITNTSARGLREGADGVERYDSGVTGGFDAIQAALAVMYSPTSIETWLGQAGLLPAGSAS